MSADQEQWLRERGWEQWYNDAYWVHPKTVENPKVQDYTNYGLSLDRAVAFEQENARPFASIGGIERAISALYQPGYRGA